MAIPKISDNDFITIGIKNIIESGNWKYLCLYRTVTKTGKTSIDGRKIKFYVVRYNYSVCTTKCESFKSIRKKIKKFLKWNFGGKYSLLKEPERKVANNIIVM